MVLICSVPVCDPYILVLQLISRILARDSLVRFSRSRKHPEARYRETRRCDPTRRARNEGVAIRVSRSVEEPLCSSIIVNPNKRERVRAKLRVGHKIAWRRTAKTGPGTRGRPAVLVSGSGLPLAGPFHFTTWHADPPRSPLGLSGGSEITAVVARIRRSGDSMLLSRSPHNDNREKRNV